MVSPGIVSGLLAAAISAAPERSLLLEADIEPAQVYVQAHALYRLRLYQAIDVRDLTFHVAAPRLAELQPIGQGRVYETLRDGRRYRVHERSYAIRPYASGALILAGAHVNGRIPAAGTPDGRHTLRMDAPARTLQVLPVPPDAGAASWLPAHTLNLTEVWTPALQVGQVQRRSIRIEGAGVEAGQLPELQIAAPGMAVHAEPARLENRFAGTLNIGVREQTFTMVALHTGPIVVPQVQLPWWNVNANSPAVATLPARTLQIGPAPWVTQTPTPASAAARVAPRLSPLLPGAAAMLCLAALLWHRRLKISAAWQLVRACRTGDMRGVRDGLLAWTAIAWPQEAAGTLGGLAERMDEPTARSALGKLERHLYGPAPHACDPATLTAIVRSVKRAVRYQRRHGG